LCIEFIFPNQRGAPTKAPIDTAIGSNDTRGAMRGPDFLDEWLKAGRDGRGK